MATDKDYPRLYGSPLVTPADVQSLLRDPELHWKKGRSAFEAAHAWLNAGKKADGGLPARIATLLATAPEWSAPEIVVGFFEHATALDTLVAPTNTDVLVVARLASGLGVLAVEAKAGEPFGEIISVWNTSSGRERRLHWACDLFSVDPITCTSLRWQLFHRTAAAVIEAKRFNAQHAVMLVHDFGRDVSWREDYLAFADAIGIVGAGVGALSEAKDVQGISLRLAWVRDEPLP